MRRRDSRKRVVRCLLWLALALVCAASMKSLMTPAAAGPTREGGQGPDLRKGAVEAVGAASAVDPVVADVRVVATWLRDGNHPNWLEDGRLSMNYEGKVCAFDDVEVAVVDRVEGAGADGRDAHAGSLGLASWIVVSP